MITLLLACTGGSPDSDSPRPGPEDDSALQDTATSAELPEGALVLDGVTVIDASQRTEAAAVVVLGGEVHAVLEGGQDWPDTVTVEALDGAFVVPGLIDSHVHLYGSGTTWWVGDTLAENLLATLYWGVTGVQDAGGPDWVLGVRDRLADGSLLGPRTLASGPFLTAAGSHPCEGFNDPEVCTYVDGDGAEQASELLAAGADRLKVALVDNGFTDHAVPRLDLGDLAEIAEQGPVLAHVAEVDDVADAHAAGVTTLAHAVFAEPVTPASAELVFDAVHTTVSAAGGIVDLMDGADLDGERYAALPEVVRDSWGLVQDHPEWLADGWVEDNRAWRDQTRENLVVYREHAAPLVPASDAGYWMVAHGIALHDELAELVAAGASPLEALSAATVDAALALGWRDHGLVAEGYRADLVVLDADPTDDVAALQQIRLVVRDGELYERAALLGADPWRAASTAVCLDDRDCDDDAACDLTVHGCTEACDEPYATFGACDEDSWCMPADGVATTTEGVCHVEPGCDWKAQDCTPASYDDTCVPADVDTSYCWPSGPREAFESCSYNDPDLRCAPNHYCSLVNGLCYELCDPAGPDTCAIGSCNLQYAAVGEPWFGLCY